MIRAVAVLSLLAMLVLVLYVPSVRSPAELLQVLRDEHQGTVALSGADAADQRLTRALRLQSDAAKASPLPAVASQPPAPGIHGAIASEMASVNRRMFDNAYTHSVDALLLLASYRLVGLISWLPWILPLALAATVDGAWVRVIKSKEFSHHNPELFALWCCLLILLCCSAVVALAMPMVLHPLLLPLVPAVASILLGLSIASFHRRA